jgi:cell division protein FtsL
MKKNSTKASSQQPILRFRPFLIRIAFLLMVISGPLLIVWKQVYINNASIKLNKMSDSLNALRREIASLEIQCERYSSTDRIERFARENLQLEYPVSSQIVVVKTSKNMTEARLNCDPREILSHLKRVIGKDRG